MADEKHFLDRGADVVRRLISDQTCGPAPSLASEGGVAPARVEACADPGDVFADVAGDHLFRASASPAFTPPDAHELLVPALDPLIGLMLEGDGAGWLPIDVDGDF